MVPSQARVSSQLAPITLVLEALTRKELAPQNFKNLVKVFCKFSRDLAIKTASSANIRMQNYTNANLNVAASRLASDEGCNKNSATLSKNKLKINGDIGQPYFTPLFIWTVAEVPEPPETIATVSKYSFYKS